MVLAQEEARLLNHDFIGTEHLLLGVIHEGEGVGYMALQQLGVSLEAVREKVEATVGRSTSATGGSPPFTPRAKKVLELSLREALQYGHDFIGTEHILLGLVKEGEGVGAQVLVDLGADLSRVRQQVIQLLSGYGHDVGPGRPRCPKCSASLKLSYVQMDAEPGDGQPEEGAAVLPVTALHCSVCGATIAVIARPSAISGP
jgi:ATP-dependent Clp protease ATP-binding subunit ClpA